MFDGLEDSTPGNVRVKLFKPNEKDLAEVKLFNLAEYPLIHNIRI